MNTFDYTDKTKKLINSFNSDIFKTDGYESPITGYMNHFAQQILEERDNAVVGVIREQFAIDVNREELIKALSYDRDQYNKGYSDGYKEAQATYARPQGKWEYNQYDGNVNIGNWHCSECRHIIYGGLSQKPYYKFCPMCGADMTQGERE